MNSGSNAKRIALSGILGALAIVCLFLAAYLPAGRLGFYAVSSFLCAIIIIEFGGGAGWAFYAATSLLSLMLVPDKLGIVPYIMFFGIYAIIKYYIEKLDKILSEVLLKLAFFNVCLGLAYLLVRQVFSYAVDSRLPWAVLIIAAEAAFVVYDYIFSRFAAYYSLDLRKHLKI